MTKTNASILMAVAFTCAIGGGMAGYGIRSTRAERELAAMESAPRPRPVAAAAPKITPAASPTPAAPASASPAEVPLPALATAPKESTESKFRKLAAYLAKAIKMQGAPASKTEIDQKDAMEFLALLQDPDMKKYMNQYAKGGVGNPMGLELCLALYEEFDVHLDASQKSRFEQLFNELAEQKTKRDQESATAIDERIAEFEAARVSAEKISDLLTAKQRESAAPLLRLHQSLGMGVPVAVDAADRAASPLLDAWSRSMIPLGEDEKARLAQAAADHAGRLTSLQAELCSRYGATFIDQFAGCLGFKTEFFAAPDPVLEANARDAYGRFLELERQNRQALMAALPERAEEIRKAQPNVYLLAFKKR